MMPRDEAELQVTDWKLLFCCRVADLPDFQRPRGLFRPFVRPVVHQAFRRRPSLAALRVTARDEALMATTAARG